jgi:hypothetical protein
VKHKKAVSMAKVNELEKAKFEYMAKKAKER